MEDEIHGGSKEMGIMNEGLLPLAPASTSWVATSYFRSH